MNPAAVADDLEACDSLDSFHARCAPLGVHESLRFLHVELDLSNRCNLRCVMCHHSLEATRRAATVYLSPDDFSRAAARVLPHARGLSLSLGNEPLMSPHFIDILRIAGSYRLPLMNFFTNGLLLRDAHIEAIIEHGVTQVCFSIEGATPATYEAIRRGGDFRQLVRNVQRLVRRRDGAGRMLPRVRFDVVMMKRSIHELADVVTLGARLGVQQLSLRHVVPFEGLDVEHESLQDTKALSNYWLERALQAAEELGLEVQTRPAFFELEFDPWRAAPVAPAASARPFQGMPYCPFPFFHISMGPGGHILPCPYSHGEEPYGRLSADTPLDQIWLGPKFTALRQRILRNDPPAMCQRCPYLGSHFPDAGALFASRRH